MRIGFLNNIGYTLLTFVITYTIGHLVYGLISGENKTSAKSEFIKNVLGAGTIIVLYSIIKTGFITINIGVLLLLLFYWWHNRPKIKPQINVDGKMVFSQLLILTILYTFLYFLLFGIKERPYIWIMIDHTLYASYIDRLNSIGAEGRESDFFFREPVRNIYHFGELWYTAFFTWLYKHNTLQVLYFAVFPNFLATIIVGGKALIEHYFKKDKWYQWIPPFSIIFLSGIVFYYPKSVEFFSLSWGNDTILASIKYTPLTILILWAFFYIIDKKIYNAILLMLACTLINTATLPAVFIGLSVFICSLYISQEIKTKETILAFIPLLFTGLFIANYAILIGILNKKNLSFDNSFETNFSLSDQLNNLLYYKTFFNCIIGTLIKFFLSTIPFGILFLLAGKKWILNNKYLLIFVGSFVFSTAVAYGIFHFEFDGTQFWTMVYIPMISVFLYLIIISTNAFNPSLITKVYTGILFFLLLYPYLFIKRPGLNFRQYTNSIRYITDNIPYNNTENIAVFYPKSVPVQTAGYDRNHYYPYSHIKLYINNYHPFCLSEFDTLLSEDPYIRSYQQKYLKRSLFYRYVERQKQQKLFSSIEQSQLDFIKEARVKYVLSQSGATLPGLILPLVEKEIKDTLSPSSMDKLYILKDFK